MKMEEDVLEIDVWSDLVCPWCYIGKRNLETALSQFGHRARVAIHWHAFELDPGLSREPGLTLLERSRQDLGGTSEQAAERLKGVSELAAGAGLDYRLERALPVNSFDAHRLVKLGETVGRGESVLERLMRAYTAEGAVLSDFETLVRLGGEAGLDPDRTREMLRGNNFAQAVHDDRAEAFRLGIGGVPSFVFDRRLLLSGGRTSQDFLRALETAWRTGTDTSQPTHQVTDRSC
ncbi:DsbA family oxidoreductase [Nocardia sp. NPDC050799]|uniref:DsbA family oxidoreductase n=1 Tax=Nocardia sp. NPDC050799 TaxID=3154842 RepID=UPI0033E566F8